ncbi:MAG: SGNH/GDSL hydrolase family protein, partial [Pseudomonadota bacterium]
PVIVDLSGLADGALTTEVTATVGVDSVTVAGPALQLSANPSADDDGNLALTAPDTEIGLVELTSVVLTVAGLDADASAEVTVTDSQGATVSATTSVDGDVVLDLSALAPGALATSVRATDPFDATVEVAGPGLSLETVPPGGNFSSETRALSIDLGADTFSFAATVLPFGDSLTQGVVDDDEGDPERAFNEGYRRPLHEDLLDQGVWIDFVGRTSSGNPDFIDPDHSGYPGQRLSRVVTNEQERDSDFDATLAELTPDITLFMMGSNDIFRMPLDLNRIRDSVDDIATVIDQFYAIAGSEGRYLVISEIPPATINGVPAEWAEYYNQGFSIVNGEPVVGDVGNGTFEPGIRQVVEARQADHPTLLFFDSPTGLDDLASDELHLLPSGYAEYAEALSAFLETNIGFSGGTIGGLGAQLGGIDDVIGGSAGDLISGSAVENQIAGGAGNDVILGLAGDDVLDGGQGSDRVNGGAGADTMIGGADGDAFVFGTDFAQGSGAANDRVADFGDGTDWLIFPELFDGRVTATDGAGGAVVLSVDDGTGGVLGLIEVEGTGAAALKGAALGGGTFELTTDPVLVQYLPETDSLFA